MLRTSSSRAGCRIARMTCAAFARRADTRAATATASFIAAPRRRIPMITAAGSPFAAPALRPDLEELMQSVGDKVSGAQAQAQRAQQRQQQQVEQAKPVLRAQPAQQENAMTPGAVGAPKAQPA